MGFLLKALGIGLTIAGVSKIRHNIKEETRRKSTICRFDGKYFQRRILCHGQVRRKGSPSYYQLVR